MRGTSTIRVQKQISNDEKGQKELEVFRAFLHTGLQQFKDKNFEVSLEIKELAPEKKEKKS